MNLSRRKSCTSVGLLDLALLGVEFEQRLIATALGAQDLPFDLLDLDGEDLGLMDPFVSAPLPTRLCQSMPRRSTLAASARLFMTLAAPANTDPSGWPIGSCDRSAGYRRIRQCRSKKSGTRFSASPIASMMLLAARSVGGHADHRLVPDLVVDQTVLD